MELLADAVADERPDDAVAELLRMRFDRLADVVQRATRLDRFDAQPHRLLGDAHELPALRVDVADEERGVGIAVYAAVIGGDIEVDDVAVEERA